MDLRGRGHSAALPGPYGFDAHVADLRDAVRALGLIPAELAQHWQAAAPALRVQTIPETNHYTILFSPSAAPSIAAQLHRD